MYGSISSIIGAVCTWGVDVIFICKLHDGIRSKAAQGYRAEGEKPMMKLEYFEDNPYYVSSYEFFKMLSLKNFPSFQRTVLRSVRIIIR